MLLALGLKGVRLDLTERLGIQRLDGLVLAIFYAVVGLVHLVIFIQSDFVIVTSAILGVLSLITAFGLLTVRKWAVWLVVGLFFPQFVFGLLTLYAALLEYSTFQELTLLLLNIGFAVFTFLIFVSFVYVAAKRKSFQKV